MSCTSQSPSMKCVIEHPRQRFAALACVALLLSACGSNELLTPDAGPRPDGATPAPDGSTPMPDKSTPVPDSSVPAGDLGLPAIPARFPCDPACLAEDSCVRDPVEQTCVECVDNAHCAGHPSGPVCSSGSCTCEGDSQCAFPSASGTKCRQFPALRRCGCDSAAECAGTTYIGPSCFGFNHKCVCAGDDDCVHPGLGACQLPYFYADYRQCEPACTKDEECPKERLGRCEIQTGLCFECLGSDDCASVDRGHRCMPDRRCRCETNADCPPDRECMEEAFSTTKYCFVPK